MMNAKEICKAGMFNAAVALMDDEIRETIHNEYAPCSDEEFLSQYMAAHLEKYGEEFTI